MLPCSTTVNLPLSWPAFQIGTVFTSYWMFVDMSVFITIKTSMTYVVLWCALIRHNKHDHTEIMHVMCCVLVVYSTCRMVIHHCIGVHTRVTRTYATYCWIQKELVWTLLMRWVYKILCIKIIVIVCYVVSFNKAVLLCIIIFMHLFIWLWIFTCYFFHRYMTSSKS